MNKILKKLSFASKSAALACSVAFASLSPAHAMDFNLVDRSNAVLLKMDGEINLGDTERMVKYMMSKLELIHGRPIGLLVSSNGGNVGEALRMIDVTTGGTVIVKDTCASACFFIFAAAKTKVVGPEGHVGVHSVAIIPGHPEVNAGELTADMVKKLREMGVPDDVCMDMLTTSNDSIHWLSKDQLTRMHASVQ